MTVDWFENTALATVWSGESNSEKTDSDDEPSRWNDHVKAACELITGDLKLGRMPSDLPDVLAKMAVSGFGNVMLRAMTRVMKSGTPAKDNDIRSSAAKAGWRFLSLFNSPEATSLLRSTYQDQPYWQSVLDYCTDGGLQSVMDEYVHVLHDSLGLMSKKDRDAATELSQTIRSAVSLRTAPLGVDIVTVTEFARSFGIDSSRMRTHFAMRFGQEKSEDGKEVTRAEQVREAFNSPFWPFVLATTSVGQEGLDFHPYCHAIVHWNLPSNPVDLEQREGRIHRFKGHAVRKNLAKQYGVSCWSGKTSDPWQEIFLRAIDDRTVNLNDLIPYWIYPLKDGAHIERYVPALPLSRDTSLLNTLRRSQAVYRMVFGQARQEDLVSYLVAHFNESEIMNISNNLLINLSPESCRDNVGGGNEEMQ